MSSFSIKTIHRGTKIGQTLNDTLDDMINKNIIDQSIQPQIMQMFDQILMNTIRSTPRQNRGQIKGKIEVYNHCDSVWNFTLKDVKVTQESMDLFFLDLLKITAVESNTIVATKSKKENYKKKLTKTIDKPKQKKQIMKEIKN